MKKLSALIGLALCGQVWAAGPGEPLSADRGAWSVQYGAGEGNNRLTVNRETAPLWQYRFSSSRIELVGEFGLSYWWTTQDPMPRYDTHVWQVSAIPMFRWWATQKFFVEAGIGATAFSSTKFNDKNISSAFQFGDHIGVGYQFNPSTRLGVRVSHFSNAGIKHPNPGINNVAITLAHSF